MVPNQAHVRYTAAQYDQYTSTFVKPYDDMLAGWVLKRAQKLPPDFTLLDVGTGTARFLIHLAGMPELAAAKLVGTDVFDDMITAAAAAVSDTGFSNRIELLLDDVHDMKLPDEYADVIVSRSTLHHWKESEYADPLPRALSEIYRVLKKGGSALIVDVRRDAPQAAIDEFNRLRQHAGMPPSFMGEKFTADEILSFARAAGIGDYSTLDVGTDGLSALGLSLHIRKPRDI